MNSLEPLLLSLWKDLHDVRVLVEAAQVHPRVLKDPAPTAVITAFADSGIDLELCAWVTDPE